MSKFNHSKGPWFYTGSCVWGVTQDSDGDPEPYKIADSGEDDARLISCAPEMLDALIEAFNVLNDVYNCPNNPLFRITKIKKDLTDIANIVEKATGLTMYEVMRG
jgi:hypothetical protein